MTLTNIEVLRMTEIALQKHNVFTSTGTAPTVKNLHNPMDGLTFSKNAIQYSFQIPEMTESNLPEGLASASTEYSLSVAAWKAMDKNTSTYWRGTAIPAWLEYEFDSPLIANGYYMRSYGITSYIPVTWTFEAWDGSDWVVLDTQTDLNMGNSSTRAFPIDNTTAYSRYRLNITAIFNGGQTPYITEFDILKLKV